MIKEKLLNDLKEAMKDKNLVRKNTVQMVRAAVLQVEKDKQIELTDEQVIEIIAKEAKKRKDAETGATNMKDMGTVMKAAKEKIGAAADGKTISDAVKKLLSK